MMPQEILTELIQIAEMLKEAYQDMRTHALRRKKAMQNFRQFINNELKESELWFTLKEHCGY